MLRRSFTTLLAGASLALLAGCGSASGPGVEIRDAWSPAAPPGAGALAVYGEIVSQADDVLLSVSSPIAMSAELHSTHEENGMMRMRPVERLELKQGEAVRLASGGLHLMLMGTNESPAAGASIPLTFRFERAGTVSVAASVR